MLISDNVDFRGKNITRDKEGHFKMTMALINPEATWIKWRNCLKDINCKGEIKGKENYRAISLNKQKYKGSKQNLAIESNTVKA